MQPAWRTRRERINEKKEKKQGPYKAKQRAINKILAKRIKYPEKSCEDIGKEMRAEGVDISDGSIRDVLKKFGLDKVKKRHSTRLIEMVEKYEIH